MQALIVTQKKKLQQPENEQKKTDTTFRIIHSLFFFDNNKNKKKKNKINAARERIIFPVALSSFRRIHVVIMRATQDILPDIFNYLLIC